MKIYCSNKFNNSNSLIVIMAMMITMIVRMKKTHGYDDESKPIIVLFEYNVDTIVILL